VSRVRWCVQGFEGVGGGSVLFVVILRGLDIFGWSWKCLGWDCVAGADGLGGWCEVVIFGVALGGRLSFPARGHLGKVSTQCISIHEVVDVGAELNVGIECGFVCWRFGENASASAWG
jgi:hypothetical protein